MINLNQLLTYPPKSNVDGRRQIVGIQSPIDPKIYYPTYSDDGSFVHAEDETAYNNDLVTYNQQNGIPQQTPQTQATIPQQTPQTQATIPQQQAIQNPLQLWSSEIAQSSTQTDYDPNIADAYGQRNLGIWEQNNSPIFDRQKSQADQIMDLYLAMNPDKVEPAKEDVRLAGIQTLATALSDLGRAAGKSLGNNDGLGMVTIDNANKFNNMYEYLRKSQNALKQAQAEKDKERLLVMIDNLKQKNKADMDYAQGRANAYQQGYNQGMKASQKSVSQKNVWKDPNSKEEQERQAKVRREIEKEAFDRDYKKQSLALKREANSLKRQEISTNQNGVAQGRGKNEKIYRITNPFYKNENWLSSRDKKLLHDGDKYMDWLVNAEGNVDLEFENKNQLDNFYRLYYPTIKKQLGSDTEWAENSDKKISQIEESLQQMKANNMNRDEYFSDFIKARQDSGMKAYHKRFFNNIK